MRRKGRNTFWKILVLAVFGIALVTSYFIGYSSGQIPIPPLVVGHQFSQISCPDGGCINAFWLGANAVTTEKIAPSTIKREDVNNSEICTTEGGLGCPADPLEIPSGAVMFFNLTACPSGWSEITAARGRYLVGLPLGGTLGGSAGTPLSNVENRAVGRHNHQIPLTTDLGFGFVNGPENFGGIQAGTMTTADAGTVVGTNAPYLQLLVCRKN